MARALLILAVLGGLCVFLEVYSEGVDRAFGGAVAHVWKSRESKLRWPSEPALRQMFPERAEPGEHAPMQPIGQRVREHVNRAMDEGARRSTGSD